MAHAPTPSCSSPFGISLIPAGCYINLSLPQKQTHLSLSLSLSAPLLASDIDRRAGRGLFFPVSSFAPLSFSSSLPLSSLSSVSCSSRCDPQEGRKAMFQSQVARPLSCRESLKAIEADIHHANSLAAAIQRAHGGACIQMRLSFSPFATVYLFLLQWLDCACAYSLPSYLGLLHVLVYKVYTDGKTTASSYKRQATLREFYGVIYPSLQQLESDITDMDNDKEWDQHIDRFSAKKIQEWNRLSDKELEREKECGICMEPCTKMVLPNCNHAMCINCYHDWNTRSESCPFCRGSLRRITSRDLWVLTNDGDVVDTETVAKENLSCFYHYIDKLPLAIPDTLFLVYYDYLV